MNGQAKDYHDRIRETITALRMTIGAHQAASQQDTNGILFNICRQLLELIADTMPVLSEADLDRSVEHHTRGLREEIEKRKKSAIRHEQAIDTLNRVTEGMDERLSRTERTVDRLVELAKDEPRSKLTDDEAMELWRIVHGFFDKLETYRLKIVRR